MPLIQPRSQPLEKPTPRRDAPKTVPQLKLVAPPHHDENSGRMHVASDQDIDIPDLSVWRGR